MKLIDQTIDKVRMSIMPVVVETRKSITLAIGISLAALILVIGFILGTVRHAD